MTGPNDPVLYDGHWYQKASDGRWYQKDESGRWQRFLPATRTVVGPFPWREVGGAAAGTLWSAGACLAFAFAGWWVSRHAPFPLSFLALGVAITMGLPLVVFAFEVPLIPVRLMRAHRYWSEHGCLPD